ncbi:RES family NAD+ phosphorylase [Blastomonas aquatica]|nr:RES family NAD+ phosphorylase [Blastomonas aquatica]
MKEQSARKDDDVILLCAECFQDRGLRLLAKSVNVNESMCPNCGAVSTNALTRDQLLRLSDLFFVKGSTVPTRYGGAPAIQFNDAQPGSLSTNWRLSADVELIQRTLGIGFFHYGPRLWMIGYITPLEDLQDEASRPNVIAKIVAAYPSVILTDEEFYRVRKAPKSPTDPGEYDAPPEGCYGDGRLDAPGFPVLYGSQDAEICVHEARFIAGDELYIATLRPARPLKLIDLSAILQEDCTEFESLDLAVLMLFLAKSHAYPILREIAAVVREHGFDGIIYPSFFSTLRTGGNPFETVYGLSTRRYGQANAYEQSKVIGNLALFGRPIDRGDVAVISINRLTIGQVNYQMIFGPSSF